MMIKLVLVLSTYKTTPANILFQPNFFLPHHTEHPTRHLTLSAAAMPVHVKLSLGKKSWEYGQPIAPQRSIFDGHSPRRMAYVPSHMIHSPQSMISSLPHSIHSPPPRCMVLDMTSLTWGPRLHLKCELWSMRNVINYRPVL